VLAEPLAIVWLGGWFTFAGALIIAVANGYTVLASGEATITLSDILPTTAETEDRIYMVLLPTF